MNDVNSRDYQAVYKNTGSVPRTTSQAYKDSDYVNAIEIYAGESGQSGIKWIIGFVLIMVGIGFFFSKILVQ